MWNGKDWQRREGASTERGLAFPYLKDGRSIIAYIKRQTNKEIIK